MNEMLKRTLSHRTTEQQMLDELREIKALIEGALASLAQPEKTTFASYAEERRYKAASQQAKVKK